MEKRKYLIPIISIALLAVILAGILSGTVYKKKPAEIKAETVKENQTYEMPKAMTFTAKNLAAAQANGQMVDVKIIKIQTESPI